MVMLTLAITSLSGGQGKTTAALMLGRLLSQQGIVTLMIDADPQHNLTTYLGFELQPNQPTLLEFIKKSVTAEDCIYPVEGNDNLFLIPSDDQLDNVQDYLSNSGVGATLLKRRLEAVADVFKVCIIDAPPQRSQICLSVMGGADFLIIPAEASVKGYGSLVRTLDLLYNLQDIGATKANKQAINKRTTLSGMGFADLEYPFELLISKVKKLI
jgi:chromosome partitioning protein